MRTKLIASVIGLAISLTMVLAACGGDFLFGTAPALLDTATLSELQGTVQIKNPDQAEFSAAVNGDMLQVQGQIRTGSDGRVRLDLSTGTIVRVAPDSLFTLEANEQQDGSLFTHLLMQAGQVWVILNGGQMEVQTPSGTASVRGSFMSVWVDPVTEDVWVTCLEGWCQAENPTAIMDMVAGEGAMLYRFDPEGNVPPPPPQLRYLSQEEIDTFLANNPEAQEIMNAVIATASALPPLSSAATPTPADSCFELGLPENGTQVAAEGLIQFDWYDQPEAYKYIITVVKPNGAEKSWIAWRSSIQIDALDLPLEGVYSWSVTAYDANIHPICTSDTLTFSKPATLPSPEATCFELTFPEDGAELPETGPITFTWQEQPGRYKFVITLTKPDGSEFSKIVWTNSYTLEAEALPLGGAYQWQVTAYDSNIRPICTSGPRTFTKPGTPIPTPNESGCVTLLTPADGAALDADGPVEFTWSAHPQAYKYLVYFKGPNGYTASMIAWTPYHLRYMGSLPEGGTYEWWVTVKDGNLNPICSSVHFTFTKPQATLPEVTPGETGEFWNQSGPIGNIAGCNATFSVDTNAPASAMVKVIYSENPVPNGYIDPHYILSHQGGTQYSTSVTFDGFPAGKTVYWRFAIIDGGVYTHDTNIYSFVSPGCPSGSSSDTPTNFSNGSGPAASSTTCSNHFQVDAVDPEGLQYVKVKYKVYDTSANIVEESYQHLSYQSGDTWAGDLSIPMQPNYTVSWWFWAIDNNGHSAYSDGQSFIYTGGSVCP
jgi:hypothetical protein